MPNTSPAPSGSAGDAKKRLQQAADTTRSTKQAIGLDATSLTFDQLPNLQFPESEPPWLHAFPRAQFAGSSRLTSKESNARGDCEPTSSSCDSPRSNCERGNESPQPFEINRVTPPAVLKSTDFDLNDLAVLLHLFERAPALTAGRGRGHSTLDHCHRRFLFPR